MTMLAIINRNTNVCVNVSSDNRPIEDIILDEPFFAINLETTPAIDWVWDTELNEWVEVQGIGNGGMGDIYENGILKQPHP